MSAILAIPRLPASDRYALARLDFFLQGQISKPGFDGSFDILSHRPFKGLTNPIHLWKQHKTPLLPHYFD